MIIQLVAVIRKFEEISWFFDHKGNQYTNTCPLDSFLSLFYMLHKGKVMVNPLVEVVDKSSLLARAFKELDENNATTGGVNARMLFINEWSKKTG